MSNVGTWYNTAADNGNLAVPDSTPENTTNVRDFNDAFREAQAAIRRQWNKLGWFEYGDGSGPYSAAYLSASMFEIQGVDARAAYVANSRVCVVQGATTLYGTITASAFSSGDTEVTVEWDSGSLANAAIDSVEIGVGAGALPLPKSIRDTDRDTYITAEASPDDDQLTHIADGQTVMVESRLGTTKPLQPGFSVAPSATLGDKTGAGGASYRVVFDTTLWQRGTQFGGTMDIMTAVKTGIYFAHARLVLQNVHPDAENIYLDFVRSDGKKFRTQFSGPDIVATNQSALTVEASQMIRLVSGQTLAVELYIDGMAGNTVDILGTSGNNYRTLWTMLLLA